ncbi:putative serine protease F56F10.1 [Epargyreus clarus]|uniref:putative serine protease F56F10.1 n=1 Tax=Epargyreus clarus TaxID=520877 RepID=UPI003C308209
MGSKTTFISGWLLIFITSALAIRDFEPVAPSSRSEDHIHIDEGWLRVRLNHFDASNTETFPMRYLFNGRFARLYDADILIFVGGEWAISDGWLRTGLAFELARDIEAGLFYTEHRYYGETWPTANTASSELRYLTVDQALGDLAQFIQYVKSDDFERGRYKNGKVGLVGCSYAGSMATWMKLAYPHLVDAVFSDSGPLHAQEDFPEYLEVITEALRSQGGEECVASIAEAVERMTAMLEQPAGATTISNLFNTCTQIQASVPLDVATFFWYGITETFAYLVQYATPGDIPDACRVITDTSVPDAVQRLANWITSHPWPQPCIETRYTEVVAAHTNTSFRAPDVTMRLWTYQTCVEYGWYQTTSSDRHPFLNAVPLEYFHQMCKDFFGVNFNEELLRSGIARTNHFFAGLTFLPDNVVSVAGGLDPWSPMGPNVTHATPLAPVYVVPNVSHCRAIRPTGENETLELEAAKQSVITHMRAFLGRPIPPPAAEAPALVPAFTLIILAGLLTLGRA